MSNTSTWQKLFWSAPTSCWLWTCREESIMQPPDTAGLCTLLRGGQWRSRPRGICGCLWVAGCMSKKLWPGIWSRGHRSLVIQVSIAWTTELPQGPVCAGLSWRKVAHEDKERIREISPLLQQHNLHVYFYIRKFSWNKARTSSLGKYMTSFAKKNTVYLYTRTKSRIYKSKHFTFRGSLFNLNYFTVCRYIMTHFYDLLFFLTSLPFSTRFSCNRQLFNILFSPCFSACSSPNVIYHTL